jgi:eukaryotic-like serine/threonine-protein kinase
VIGESIGSYRITAKLGEGGMGAVYLGEHQFIERKAAIKVLLPEVSANKEVVQRFFNEARATAAIRHPGIVEIVDCAVLPTGSAYIIMELLEGDSLGDVLRNGARLSVRRAAHLTHYIADALAAAHEKRIVHRDLKPDNIFVLSAPEAPSPIKILDFGIAKLMSPEPGQSHKTRTGSIIGTPVYMSPEQCRGKGEIDHRTDIYSLGCILFEMLCGRPPFIEEGFGELIHCHMSIVPPPIRSFDPALPPAVETLVARMLAKSPADRPQTMRAVIEELDAAIEGAPAMTAVLPVHTPGAAAAQKTRLFSDDRMPKVPTTMRSASGEMVAGDTDDQPVGARKRRPLPLVAAGVIAVLVGGVGIWRMNAKKPVAAQPNDGEDTKVAKVVVAPSPAPVAPPPAAPPATSLPAAPPAPPQPPHVDVAPVEPPDATPVAQTVKVVIASKPPGADVCLAKNRILLGHTKLDWKTEKKSGTAKLLIRMSGFRGEELKVNLEHDVKTAVTLDKLGPDDIADVDTCEKR